MSQIRMAVDNLISKGCDIKRYIYQKESHICLFIKHPVVELMKEYLLALKATNFNYANSLFELKNRYHSDLNRLIGDDEEWSKKYIMTVMKLRIVAMAKNHDNKWWYLFFFFFFFFLLKTKNNLKR